MSLQYLTLGQWRRRPARALLTILSVSIAIIAVLGTSLAQSTVRRAFQRMSRDVEGPPALEIVATAGGRFDASKLPALGDVAGVKVVAPLVCRGTLARVRGHRLRTLIVGLDGSADSQAWDQVSLSSGRPASAANEVVVSDSVTASLEVELGTKIVFLTRRGPRSATVVGIAESRALRGLAQGATMVLVAETVQKWFSIEGEVDRARVLLVEGANRDRVKGAIETQLPSDLTVQVAVSQMVVTDNVLRSSELALQFAGALSLAMAGFIILNTLRMNFSERRRQLATLRALGATPGQISWLLVTEGLWIGLIGSTLGIPGGLALAYFLGQAMQGILQVELPAATPRWEVLLLSIASGPAVSALAAYLPALQARRISPIDEMSEIESPRTSFFRRLAAWTPAAAAVIATLTMILIVTRRIPAAAAIPTFLLLLLSFITLLPVTVRPLVRLGNWLLSWVWGIEGRLATEQLVRRPARTGLTAGVLVIAMTNGLGLGNAILNNVEDLRGWFRRSLAGDFFLVDPVAANDSPIVDDREQQETLRRLASTPGVDYVVTMRLPKVRIMNTPAQCIIREFPPHAELPWAIDGAAAEEVRKRLAAGEVVLGSVLSHELGVRAGDTVRLESRGRVVSLRVAAVVNDYNQGGMVAFLDREGAERAVELGPIEWYMLFRKPNANLDEMEAELRAFAEQRSLVPYSFAAMRNRLDQLVNGIVVSLWSLLLLGFVVGGFAVANTLTMSVLEQTREFGLLRIVGMTRYQVRKMVLSEAILLGVIGLFMGTLAGTTTAFMIHAATEVLMSRQMAFEFHAWLLGANVLGCMLVAVCSAWLPCRHATRLNLLDAIAYE